MDRRAALSVLALPLSALVLPGSALAAPSVAAPAAPPAAPPAVPPKVLQDALDAISAAGMPGASAAVRDGSVRWSGATGVADVVTGRPMRPFMRQRVGSITKTFVATVLLQLVGEGRLRLDDPVARWLPDVAGLDRRVTVRMLLNHTSGIGDWDTALFRTDEDFERYRFSRFTPWQLARIGLDEPPTGEPGAAWAYSNTNYVLAGLVIRKVTHRDPQAEITRRIIRPLRLDDTYFPRTPFVKGPHPKAYLPWPDPIGVRDFSVYDPSVFWMAGDLVSTPTDLNRFFRALLGGRLLRPAQLAAMRETVPVDPERPDGVRYGLGIFDAPTPCGSLWGHDGVVWGMSTLSFHSTDGRRQVSLAMDMSHYAVSQNPIDDAVVEFLLVAACGLPESRADGRSGAARALLPALLAHRRLLPGQKPLFGRTPPG